MRTQRSSNVEVSLASWRISGVCAGCVAVRVAVHCARGTWPGGIPAGCYVPRRAAIRLRGWALAWVPASAGRGLRAATVDRPRWKAAAVAGY